MMSTQKSCPAARNATSSRSPDFAGAGLGRWHRIGHRSLRGDLGQGGTRPGKGIGVEDQGDAAVAQHGGGGDAGHLAVVALEHLITTWRWSWIRSTARATRLSWSPSTSTITAVVDGCSIGPRKPRSGRHRRSAHRRRARAITRSSRAQRLDVAGLGAQRLDDRGDRDHQLLARDPHDHPVEHRQRQRQRDRERGALAGRRLDRHPPAQLVDRRCAPRPGRRRGRTASTAPWRSRSRAGTAGCRSRPAVSSASARDQPLLDRDLAHPRRG